MIKAAGFDIFTLIESSCFFNFFSKKLFRSRNLNHKFFNIEFTFYWLILISSPEARVWRINQIDLVFFSIDFPPQFHYLILWLIQN